MGGAKVAFDIHRFEDGVSVEHWDNLQQLPSAANPSGRTMIDGECTLTDFNKTLENKALVSKFVNEVMIDRLQGQTAVYFTDDRLLQHNPLLADGAEVFLRYVGATAEKEGRVQYDKLHLLLGEGNFVLAVSEGHAEGKWLSLYDLFRVEDAKIVEHWDVIEEIPPQSEWKNGNGKV
jgi:predicted SnoaL-like aldol condensation-catalyzing enzyme